MRGTGRRHPRTGQGMTRRKRTAFALAALVLAIAARYGRRRVRCYWYGHTKPRRIYLGLWRCDGCEKRGSSLADFGLWDEGPITRRQAL